MGEDVLITGATGFVGGALVRRLGSDGPRTPVAAFRTHSPRFPKEVRAVQVPGLSVDTDWSLALQGVAVVVHCAARVHVMKDDAADLLAEYRRVNVVGTLVLARQAVQAGVRRFVFVSSIGVNGPQSSRPFKETDTPAPVEPYAISKLEAEQGLREFGKRMGMEVTIIRPPLIYGPDAPGNFGRLVRWIALGIPLPLGAVQHNRRSLVALDNLVDLIVSCLDHPAAANEVFLAGDGEDLSTTALLQRLAGAMDRRSRLVPVPVRMLESAAFFLGKRDLARSLCGSLQVNISKAREMLDWAPPISVDEGLRKAVGNVKC